MRRRNMTYRVVSLDSEEASRAPSGETDAASDALVAELSLAAWLASGRPLPSYRRSQMPIRMTRLEQQGSDDE